jgi:hypothetical protein
MRTSVARRAIAMPFRFSLKWVLIGAAYVAIAAAAFSQRSWIFSDFLWFALLAAFAYALVLAFYARGEQQASAAGFLALAMCFLMCLYVVPDRAPVRSLYVALQSASSEVVQVQYPAGAAMPLPAPATASASPLQPAPAPAYYQPYAAAPYQPYAQAPLAPSVAYSSVVQDGFFPQRIRAAHAITSMGAGLVGSLLGAAAYRRSRRGPGRDSASA